MGRYFWILSLVCLLGGCVQKSDATRHLLPSRVALTGIVAETKTGGEYALADVRATSAGYKSLEMILDDSVNKSTEIKTKQVARLSVLEGYGTPDWQEYIVFLGPPFDSNTESKGSIKSGSAVASLVYGWIYLTGRQPMAETKRVRAGAIGSTLLVQADSIDNEEPHRVFLLDNGGRPAFAKSLIDTDEEIEYWIDDDTYIEVDEYGKFSEILELSKAPDEIKEFVEKVRIVVEAGS